MKTATEKTYRPFNLREWEVQAILNRTLTELRRVVPYDIPKDADEVFYWTPNKTWLGDHAQEGLWARKKCTDYDGTTGWIRFLGESPFGNVGDILWGRETWQPFIHSCRSGIRYRIDGGEKSTIGQDFEQLKDLVKRTGGDLVYTYGNWGNPHPDEVRHRTDWRHSTHMPRWACRIFLEVKRQRVEQDDGQWVFVAETGRIEG